MKREEEMWKYVEEEHGELSRREAMVALTAMEWADEIMIDNACEFLYEWNRKQVLKHGSKTNIGCSEFTISVYDFKKAMKGE